MSKFPDGAAHVPVPGPQVIQMSPSSSIGRFGGNRAGRLSLARTTLARLLCVQTQGVAVTPEDCAAWPSSKNIAEEPPPRNWTVWPIAAVDRAAEASMTIAHATDALTTLSEAAARVLRRMASLQETRLRQEEVIIRSS